MECRFFLILVNYPINILTLCDLCYFSPRKCNNYYFVQKIDYFPTALQSGSEFTLSPAFSTVTRQVIKQHQQHFAMYDVKQMSKLKTLYFHLQLFYILDRQGKSRLFLTKNISLKIHVDDVLLLRSEYEWLTVYCNKLKPMQTKAFISRFASLVPF